MQYKTAVRNLSDNQLPWYEKRLFFNTFFLKKVFMVEHIGSHTEPEHPHLWLVWMAIQAEIYVGNVNMKWIEKFLILIKQYEVQLLNKKTDAKNVILI